jgi:hypothetical protein
MSTYWDVHCLDCNEGLGLHANHAEDGMNRIVQAAGALADFAKACPGISIDAAQFDLYTERGMVDPAWFAKHRGHRIVARNEYGAISNQCGFRGTCTKCGHWFTCNRTPGHEGDHDPTPDAV